MTPASARRLGSHGVFAIEDDELLLSDPIALDTSFVVEALIATQPLHATCRAFLNRIDASGISITTSDLLVVELAEAAFAIALKERWGSGGVIGLTDERVAAQRACSMTPSGVTRRRSPPKNTFRCPSARLRPMREIS